MKVATSERVISIYATSRGFAYCVFDGVSALVDWGIKHVGQSAKNEQSQRLIEQLIIRFDPHCIVLEDTEDASCKRSSRVKHLYRQIEKFADRASLECYAYQWPVVFEVFKRGNPRTRHDIAVMLAEILPNISRRLPPKRKIWLPQDPRQALFDAAALGITFYAVRG